MGGDEGSGRELRGEEGSGRELGGEGRLGVRMGEVGSWKGSRDLGGKMR